MVSVNHSTPTPCFVHSKPSYEIQPCTESLVDSLASSPQILSIFDEGKEEIETQVSIANVVKQSQIDSHTSMKNMTKINKKCQQSSEVMDSMINWKVNQCNTSFRTMKEHEDKDTKLSTNEDYLLDTAKQIYSAKIQCMKAVKIEEDVRSSLVLQDKKCISISYSKARNQKPYSDNNNLRHHKAVHSGVQPFTCVICNRAFSFKSSLNRHIKCVHMSSEKRFSCTVCNKRFALKQHVKKHLKTHSKKQNELTCSVCYKYFGSDFKAFNIHSLTH